MGAPWRIELLGGLDVRRGDLPVTHFPMGKTGTLLAYLASHPQRRHSWDLLVELLWPECAVEAGRSRLSVVLSTLRHQLELPDAAPPILAADRFSVGLGAAGVTTDVTEFQAALDAAARAGTVPERVCLLGDAVDLYHGELLPGYYEDWIVPERQRLEELFFQAVRQLIAHLEQAGNLDREVQYAHRAVSADPLREEAHRELIRLYAAVGQPRAALRQYDGLKRLLKQQLDLTPEAATQALVRAIEDAANSNPPPGGGAAIPSFAQAPTSASTARRHLAPPVPGQMEPVGGAVPLDSPFYVVRPTDHEFAAAIARRDSIVLVKGPRQVGKTSLLARGLQQARQAGAKVWRGA